MSTNITPLIQTVKDAQQAPPARLRAARLLLWALESEYLDQDLERKLARTIVSRWLDDAGQIIEGSEQVGNWRRLATELQLRLTSNPNTELSERHSYLIAKLLYELGENRTAIPLFEKALRAKWFTATDAVLAAYNLENLGRREMDLDIIEAAIALASPDSIGRFRGHETAVTELKHFIGHLEVLRAIMSTPSGTGVSVEGTSLLRQAADLDPAYASCYASCFAEQGDYLGTVRTALRFLTTRPFSHLSQEDAQLISLELLFYLGYAYSCINEFEHAKSCFDAFLRHPAGMYSDEARDHARLFLVKVDLKRRSVFQISRVELEGYFRELRALSFESTLSSPVNDECRRYEKVVEFLIAFSELQPASAAQGSQIDDRTLAEVSQKSGELLNFLTHESRRAGNTLVGGLTVSEDDDTSRVSVGDLGGGRAIWAELPANPASMPQTDFIAMLSELEIIAAQGDAVNQMGSNYNADLDGRPVIALRTSHDAKSDADVNAPDSKSFIAACNLGAAVALVKRFLKDDAYILGLTPCVESPATRFQHPSYSLDEVKEGLAR